ncbi:MAG: OmpA family protein [Sphingomonadaceae bacterium]|nr:OmpA family protein [Sphingomonadaceae bacterium]
MKIAHGKAAALALLAGLSLPLSASLSAQGSYSPSDEAFLTVNGMLPDDISDLPEGPEVEGIIVARKGQKIKVNSPDGTSTIIGVSEATDIRSRNGVLGFKRSSLGSEALLNGLPVTVRTVQWGDGLIASRIDLKGKDLKIANMIRSGTEQGFAEQTAATEALRSRMADIDQYNIKGTTNVYFDTGKWNLSPTGQADLCDVARQAEATDNSLLLVVGYTDSVGDEDYNQILSERRAGRVVNFLQQKCGWKPWRMLTPTGMAESDPAADNSTAAGKAQNRRVSVNILVSKSVDGM